MRSLGYKKTMVIEPSPNLAEICRIKGINVVEKFMEDINNSDLPKGQKVFTSFELFEHLHDPSLFLDNVRNRMNSGDKFVFTTLSSTGVDIQVLWENSKSVSPPHHLNFFNPHSIKLLLEKSGFSEINVTTPGKLDLNIMQNSRDKIEDRFWNNFLRTVSSEDMEQWQTLISKTGCSSHMMVCCSKN